MPLWHILELPALSPISGEGKIGMRDKRDGMGKRAPRMFCTQWEMQTGIRGLTPGLCSEAATSQALARLLALVRSHYLSSMHLRFLLRKTGVSVKGQCEHQVE